MDVLKLKEKAEALQAGAVLVFLIGLKWYDWRKIQ